MADTQAMVLEYFQTFLFMSKRLLFFREEYVDLSIDYKLNVSVKNQFEKFKDGFYTVSDKDLLVSAISLNCTCLLNLFMFVLNVNFRSSGALFLTKTHFRLGYKI